MPHRLEYYKLQLATAHAEGRISLQVARGAAALAVARDQQAAPLARVLGAVAGGVLEASHAELIIAHTPELRQAAERLVEIGAGSQVGDLTVGQAAGRDIITVNVYVGDR